MTNTADVFFARTAGALEGLTVLLVDDQPSSLDIVSGLLRDLGVSSTIPTSRPRKALELLRSEEGNAIDVVLCDWHMPEVTGIEMLREVRVLRPDLPFFMVTGAADAASVLSAKDCGVTGYIRKPLSADELRKKLTPYARIRAHRMAAR